MVSSLTRPQSNDETPCRADTWWSRAYGIAWRNTLESVTFVASCALLRKHELLLLPNSRSNAKRGRDGFGSAASRRDTPGRCPVAAITASLRDHLGYLNNAVLAC